MSTKKRKSYSIKERIDILDLLKKPGCRVKDITERYGLTSSTVCTWIKNEEKLRKKFTTSHISANSSRTRTHMSRDFSELEEQLFEWFFQMRREGMLLNGPMKYRQ